MAPLKQTLAALHARHTREILGVLTKEFLAAHPVGRGEQ
jgi:hypothetical protein